jgi:hypothetical protein
MIRLFGKTGFLKLKFLNGGKMIESDGNHRQIVEDSLSGQRAVDERTFASLEILADRLERLKKFDKVFSRVTFSPAVKELAERKSAVPVC